MGTKRVGCVIVIVVSYVIGAQIDVGAFRSPSTNEDLNIPAVRPIEGSFMPNLYCAMFVQVFETFSALNDF